MTTRIYTKTGDGGQTGLFGGPRVSKDDARVEAYGSVDELLSALGVARAIAAPAAGPEVVAPATMTDLDAVLRNLQSLLFELGGDLATPPSARRRPAAVTNEDAAALEPLIDRFEEELQPLKSFILPGGTHLAAALHHARCVCRRAERRVVTLRRLEPDTHPEAVVVLNRMSDLLFVLARVANARAGCGDVPWTPRSKQGQG